MSTLPRPHPIDGTGNIYARIVCAVDGSAASDEAVRQAARLSGGRPVELVTVADESVAVHAGWAASTVADEIEQEAAGALAQAAALAEASGTTVLHGDPAGRILGHLRETGATLVAAGAHGHMRTTGILLGLVSTRLLHEARCSVLIARPAEDPDRFPQRILVGIDGSEQAAAAGAEALALARRFEAECVAVTATGGKAIDLAAVRESFPGDLEEFPAAPARALVELSQEADLVVLGSRGLHGLPALGSVSERVAHRAKCSVLVVRLPAEGPLR